MQCSSRYKVFDSRPLDVVDSYKLNKRPIILVRFYFKRVSGDCNP